MHSLDITLFWIAFICYFAGFLSYVLYLSFKKDLWAKIGLSAMIVGVFPQTAGFIVRWSLAEHIPLSNMYEYMGLMSWMAVFCLIWIVWRYKKPMVGGFISAGVFMLMVMASLLPKEINQSLMPALQSYWLYIHVSLAALGSGSFAVACVISIVYLLNKSSKKGWSFLSKLNIDAELLDEINYKAVSLGYPLYTIGALFAGAIWAEKAWGQFWSWDPKEVGALIIWLFYTGYLHARRQKNWRGNRAAILSILGLLMVLLSFFGNYFFGGQHAYA